MTKLILVWWQSLESRPILWLSIIVLLSFSLRLSLLLNPENILAETTRREKITLESIEYNELTYCNSYFPFCKGGEPSASVVPLPILISMAFVKLFDYPGFYLVVLLQMLLNLITILLIYKIALHMVNSQHTALLAAFLWGIYMPPIYVVELRIEAESMFTCFMAAGFLAFFTGLANNQRRYWALTGLFFGLAALSREAMLYFPFILVFFLLIQSIKSWRRCLTHSGILLATFIIVLSPWIVRNALVFHAFVPGSTLAGYNMYRHNHLLASDERLSSETVLQKVFPFLARNNLINHPNVSYLYHTIDFSAPVYFRNVSNTETKKAIKQLLAQPDVARGDENEVETDQLFKRETIKIIKAHPGRYLLLSVYRFIPLWTNLFYEDGGLTDSTWRIIGLINLILLALSVMTIIRWRHKIISPFIFPILLLIAYFMFGHMAVHSKFRFVLPLMPYIMVFAADQIVYGFNKLILRLKPSVEIMGSGGVS